MTDVVLAEKVCTKCGETKPLSEFNRQRRARDGRQPTCRVCDRQRAREWQERERAAIGEEAFLRDRRLIMDRHRRRTGDKRGRLGRQAYRKAEAELRERHRAEFDVLLAKARYELGLDS